MWKAVGLTPGSGKSLAITSNQLAAGWCMIVVEVDASTDFPALRSIRLRR
jgi:hypothetical protein